MFAPGQAPPKAFDEFLRVVRPGGLMVFSVRVHYYDSEEGAAHRCHLEQLLANGSARQATPSNDIRLVG